MRIHFNIAFTSFSGPREAVVSIYSQLNWRFRVKQSVRLTSDRLHVVLGLSLVHTCDTSISIRVFTCAISTR